MFEFELQFLKQLEALRTDFFNAFFTVISFLGEEVLTILLIVVLWFVVDKRMAQRFLYVCSGSLCINGITKNIAQVPRPFTKGISCLREDTATGYAFPSGHTQGSATLGTLLAKPVKKLWAWALAILYIFLMGFSRMYLGAHYPTDVIVGAVLGVSLALLGNLLFDKVRDLKKLYLWTLVTLAPFYIYFLFKPDLSFADAYKTYGMIGGLLLVSFTDEEQTALCYDIPWWKKLLRVIIGVAVAIILKEVIKAMIVFESMQLCLIMEAVRYLVVIFSLGYLCPLLFKKIKL